MQEIWSVSFSGVFALRDGVSENEFLPRLHAFFQHFIDMGFANGYRVMRREALDGFGKTLPAFTYRGDTHLSRPGSGTCRVRIRQTTWRGGNFAACSDELNGQTRRRLLFGDAHRIGRVCLPLARTGPIQAV